ncbi:MAG: TraR/DksA family transcriptional regulator [Hyphomicrobiaceae bacterium]
MGKLEHDWFRSQLLEKQAELASLREMSAQSREAVKLDQSSVGRVSRIDAIQQQELALAAERNRERELQRIKSALLRLDQGDFGYCVTCGEDIAEKRLRVDPAIPTCVDCAR